MLDYTALETLAAILRTGSFDAAAARLGVTPSAVSQRLKGLEDRVGAPLVHRTSPVQPTALGRRLLAHVETVAALERTALGGPEAPEALVTLRLAVNADSLGTWLLPALAQAGDVLFDLVIDDQDHAADWLRRGEVQAALGTEARAVTGCVSHPLGALRYRATASPAFMARWFPDGPTPDALARAPSLSFNAKDKLQIAWIAQTFGRRIVPPCHSMATTHGFVAAARLGMGWGLNPEALVAEALASGDLVELVPDSPLDTPLHWQVPRALKTALAPLTRAVLRAASAQLRPQ